ncbi:hypothetical protein [Tepidibacter sp. Z1-5]|uniref:hypothetical protein n=1 Tax=Tepidibacter sp. Z1-5 TaxID=3134138 RepID=UPI0030C1E4E2
MTKLTIPGIIAMLINAIYNIVDTMFVGKLNNASSVAAVASMGVSLRVFSLGVYASLFQSLGKGKEAFLLSASRQGIFLIPAILILPKFMGLDGVIFSQVVADFFTIIVTYILSRRLIHRLKNEDKKFKGNLKNIQI